jgi:hypothetical protein
MSIDTTKTRPRFTHVPQRVLGVAMTTVLVGTLLGSSAQADSAAPRCPMEHKFRQHDAAIIGRLMKVEHASAGGRTKYTYRVRHVYVNDGLPFGRSVTVRSQGLPGRKGRSYGLFLDQTGLLGVLWTSRPKLVVPPKKMRRAARCLGLDERSSG